MCLMLGLYGAFDFCKIAFQKFSAKLCVLWVYYVMNCELDDNILSW